MLYPSSHEAEDSKILRPNGPFPPEVTLLVLEAVSCKIALQRSALVSAIWRQLAQPLLFRQLVVQNNLRYASAYQLLMEDAPHLRNYVRELHITDVCFETAFYGQVQGRRFTEFLQSFPYITNLNVSYSPEPVVSTLAHVMRNAQLSSLHLGDTSISNHKEFFSMLHFGRRTLRSLKLYNVYFTESEDLSQDHVLMENLEELAIISCDNIPFTLERITMPGVHTFEWRDRKVPEFVDCLPRSLRTLAACIIRPSPQSTIPFIVPNFCLLWHPSLAHESSGERTIETLASPSHIEHLELFVTSTYFQAHLSGSTANALDRFLVNLCRDHRLQRVSITVKPDGQDAVTLTSAFPQLQSLGILHLRMGQASLFRPNFKPYS
ncbi:hypothetical protein ONZ45_g11787 [Pleurotus djamor]|nr:hypothetical protein ONZ45_g11787 [Pleurotus djamor]